MKPMMRDYQIKATERLLLDLKKMQLNILEWGSGGSTIYFTDFLDRNGIDYTWTSIEHNYEWYTKVFHSLKDKKNVAVYFFDLKDKEYEYINLPLQLGKKFDFILVDGRKRKECLIKAKELLDSDGIVMLHDAQRSRYHSAFKYYPDPRFIDRELWRGTLKNISIQAQIGNKLNYLYFRFVNLINKIMDYAFAKK